MAAYPGGILNSRRGRLRTRAFCRRGWMRTRVGYGAAWRPHLHDSRRGRLRTRTCSRRGWLRTRAFIFFGAAWRRHLLEANAACTLVFVCLFSRFVTVFLPSFCRLFTVLLPSFYRLCFEIDLQRSKDHVRGRGNYWRQKWEKICVFRKNTLSLQSN